MRYARYARAFLAALTVVGCSGESAPHVLVAPSVPAPLGPTPDTPAPTTPAPPDGSSPRGFVWVKVLEDSGVCIAGATVLVVGGEGLGQSRTQDQPCDAWSYDEGITFKDLTVGAAMTLRASAPGYATAEVTATPQLGGFATEIVLSRTP